MDKTLASRRRWLATLPALALPLHALAGYNIFTQRYTLSRDELQQRLAKRFPLRRGYSKLIEMELSAPVLSLDAQANRVRIAMRLELRNALLQPASSQGVLNVSATLVYDAPSRSIKLGEAGLDRIDLDLLNAQGSDLLTRLGNFAAHDLLQGEVLYTFEPDQLHFGPFHYEPNGISVAADGLVLSLK